MGISIVETTTSGSTSFAYTTVLENDVGVVVVKAFDDGSGTGFINMPLGWHVFYSTSSLSLMAWQQFAGGETIHTITATNVAGVEIIATLMRSDTTYGTLPLIDLQLPGGTSGATSYADDVVLAHTASESGPGSFTASGTWATLATTGDAALYAASPLQVAAGTSYAPVAGGSTTSFVLVSLRPWNPLSGSGGSTPTAALLAAVSSFAWIID